MTVRLKSNARHATEANWSGGSREKIVGANGELNAGSRLELQRRILELSTMISNQEIFTDASHVHSPDNGSGETVSIEEAYYDPEAWAELGSGLADELNERMQRSGFMRTLLNRADVAEGSIVRLRVRTPNVQAIVSRGPGMVYPQFVRDRFLSVDEFTIAANPRVEELDIHQGSGDILEDKFYEAQEQVMVKEDRHVTAQLRATGGLYNAPLYFVGNMTPTILRGLMQNIQDFNLPASNLTFSNDILSDITVGSAFSTYFDPVSKLEIVQTGNIGNLMGLSLNAPDGFREPTLQVLERGEVFCTTQPEFLGSYTDRGPVSSNPVSSYPDGVAARGWYVHEHISCTVTNAKGVSFAKRQ